MLSTSTLTTKRKACVLCPCFSFLFLDLNLHGYFWKWKGLLLTAISPHFSMPHLPIDHSRHNSITPRCFISADFCSCWTSSQSSACWRSLLAFAVWTPVSLRFASVAHPWWIEMIKYFLWIGSVEKEASFYTAWQPHVVHLCSKPD